MSYSSLPLTSKLFQLTSLTCALALAGCGGGDGDTVDSIAPPPDLVYSQVLVGVTITVEATIMAVVQLTQPRNLTSFYKQSLLIQVTLRFRITKTNKRNLQQR